jgi:hypothetical protein
VQVTLDAADPRRLGQFWASVLGYIEQPPPPGFDGAGLAGEERPAAARQRANGLIALGATEVRAQSEFGESWIVMQDPEGNEFCLQ